MLGNRVQASYFAPDTIAAIGTALGGAISMIRLSGPKAFEALKALGGDSASEARKLVRCRLKAAGRELDDAMSVRFVAPESYSGEDVVELHLHGGGFIAARVMEELSHLGVRQALPGEFSFRAVRNGKLSVPQAQAVADLIAASNDGAVGLALEKLSGSQNELLAGLARELRHLAVLGEAGIDFADQDIEEVSLPALRRRLGGPISHLETLHQSYDRGSRVQDGVRVAFVGLPNAGKSSFFNALLGEDRSIVSEEAGTTRDVVRERITLRGTCGSVTLRLEDTAGLREAQNNVERMGVERTRAAARAADLIVLVVDPSQPLEELETVWEGLEQDEDKAIVIFTKADLHPPGRAALALFGISRFAHTSAVSGAGMPQAIELIVQSCEKWLTREPREVLLTRQDQLQAVESALVDLKRALQAPEIELYAADLRQALHSLGPLIGETLPDDILGKIFSEFCIGK